VGAGGSGERPLRAQIVVALVVVAMLIAVPLYLLRRPGQKSGAAAPSASASAGSGPRAQPSPSAAALPIEPPPRIKLGPVQKVRCGASASATPNEGALCDSLPFFEQALKTAIVDTEDCAPKLKTGGTINYVLTVDFPRKKLHVYPGASGEWRGKQARRATSCVAKSIKVPDWAAIPHQYRFYAIAILASYAALQPVSAPAFSGSPGLPNFE
jgi:hypothetical protein